MPVCMTRCRRSICSSKSMPPWTLAHRGRFFLCHFYVAHFYTDFVLIDGILYFGTAGKGGHFYDVCPEDGIVVGDINIGGTTCFFRMGEKSILKERLLCAQMKPSVKLNHTLKTSRNQKGLKHT
jgi:hypothetical protein